MVTLTRGQERFARIVSTQTGLQLQTVRTWVVAESGGRSDRDGNPLSIMSDGRLADYRTPEAAALRTVQLLRGGNDTYAHVLKVARDPRSTVEDELQAIADSDWEGGGYAGTSGRRGTLLAGAYARVTGNNSTAAAGSSTTPVMLPFTPGLKTPLPKSGKDPLTAGAKALTGWVGDFAGWIGETAGKAFLYFAFTVLALLLIVMGGMRSLGVGPASLRSAAASRGPGTSSSEIPF